MIFMAISQPTPAPVANKLRFYNTKRGMNSWLHSLFAYVVGEDEAVEANSVVKIYSSPAKDKVLGTVIATATGSFRYMLNNSSSLQTVHVTARTPGKAESAVTTLSASATVSATSSVLTSATVTATSSVLIVKYHSGNFGEWITLANVTDNDINLSNWKMSEYSNYNSIGSTWTIPGGTVIKRKSLLIVKKIDGSGITGAAQANIPVVQTSLSPALSLGREQEKIILLDPNNIQVDEFIFQTAINGSWIWYSGNTPFLIQLWTPPTINDAFVRKSVTDTNTAADWKLVTGSSSNPIKAWEWTPINNTDTTPPVVVSIEPADGTANVALDAVLKVKFNETIKAGSEVPTIYSYYEGRFISPEKIQASVSGNELSIKHTAFWSGDWCDVIVPIHTVTDQADNSFVNTIYWSFTTGNYPSSMQPVANKICFNNTTPAAAKVKGSDGAVEPNAEVTVYSLGDQFLGATTATATGSFLLTIDTTTSLEPFYVYAVAPGKSHSAPTNLTASNC